MRKTLFLYSLGIYATIATIATLSTASNMDRLFGFVAVMTARVYYEQLVIYSLPWKATSFWKNLTLGIINGAVISIIYQYLKEPLGYFSIPLAIVVGTRLAALIKERLWQKTVNPLSSMLDCYQKGLYIFYLILGFGTYLLINKGSLAFATSFTLATFAALLFTLLYEWTQVHKQNLNFKLVTLYLAASILIAIVNTFLALALIQWGLSGAVVCISSAIVLKSAQSRLMVQKILKRSAPCSII